MHSKGHRSRAVVPDASGRVPMAPWDDPGKGKQLVVEEKT